MSKDNWVSLNINEADLQEIKNAVQVLQTKLVPHLVGMTTDERKELPKMGDKSVVFVSKSAEYANQNPSLVPQYIDLEELSKDIAAIEILRQIQTPLEQLIARIDDTAMIAGSEAYKATLAFYNAVKGAAKAGVPNAQLIYDDLCQRFPGRGKKKVI